MRSTFPRRAACSMHIQTARDTPNKVSLTTKLPEGARVVVFWGPAFVSSGHLGNWNVIENTPRWIVFFLSFFFCEQIPNTRDRRATDRQFDRFCIFPPPLSPRPFFWDPSSARRGNGIARRGRGGGVRGIASSQCMFTLSGVFAKSCFIDGVWRFLERTLHG